jgi:oligoendopeptidase F
MPYSRPDVEELRAAVDAVQQALEAGADYDALEPLLENCRLLYRQFYTLMELAYIRSCQDSGDTFYAEEHAWFSQACPEENSLIEALFRRLLDSPLADELVRRGLPSRFGLVESGAAESAAPFYDDEMVALLQEESRLIEAYRELLANPTVTLRDGTEVLLSEAAAGASGEALYNLMNLYLNHYNPIVAEIYINLVKNRQQQAAHAGFENYEDMAYSFLYHRDYTPRQALDYLARVKKTIPALKREIVGSAPGEGVSLSLSPERMHSLLQSGVDSMGLGIPEAYAFLLQYQLYDDRVDPRKVSSSYEAYLDSYEVPFLFVKTDGSLFDLILFAHEFGHFLDDYLNFHAPESMDLAECFSQSMEHLMLLYLENALRPEELQALWQTQLENVVLSSYLTDGLYAEFEHIVYTADPEELTPAFLNKTFLQLNYQYGTHQSHSGDYFSKSWINAALLFTQPCYAISYPVSQDVALQLLALELEQPGAGLGKYLDLLSRQSPGLLECLGNGGLESPFDEGRPEKAADTLRALFGREDLESAA